VRGARHYEKEKMTEGRDASSTSVFRAGQELEKVGNPSWKAFGGGVKTDIWWGQRVKGRPLEGGDEEKNMLPCEGLKGSRNGRSYPRKKGRFSRGGRGSQDGEGSWERI